MKKSKESAKIQAEKHFKNSQEEVSWWQPSVVLFGKLSGWIAFPVIIALFVGKWLDEKYQTEPWLFLFSVGIAFILSSVGIVKESARAMKEMSEDLEKKRKYKSRK